VLCGSVSGLWAVIGSGTAQLRSIRGSSRYAIYIYQSSLGFSAEFHWPLWYTDAPNLVASDCGVRVPILTAALGLAIAPVLKIRQHVAKRIPPKKLHIADVTLSLFCGFGAFTWFLASWLPANESDDIEKWIGGTIGIALPVVLIWIGCREAGKSLLGSLRKPHIEGVCHVCGYDLRATPNRCPECGTVPPASASFHR
jgi:hypothetical protein